MQTEAKAVREILAQDLVEFSGDSIYEWGPVFKARVRTDSDQTVDAVVKPTLSKPDQAAALGNWQRHVAAAGVVCVQPLRLSTVELPVHAAGSNWMAYPWIEGISWDGSTDAIAAAGKNLGLLHTVSSTFDGVALPHFAWPVFSQESVDEDVEAIRLVCAEKAQNLEGDHGSTESVDGASIAARWATELNAFHEVTVPMIRDAGLPSYAVSLDFRASNLIYTGTNEVPVFIDFENGEVAPRLLDLAVSVLLFASESEHNPGRLFTAEEWFVYLDAYQQTAPQLTTQEVQLWPEALRYMRLEWGTWQITESAEWDLPGQTGFLLDLLKLDGKQRFPLTQNKHATRAGADFPGS